MLAPVLYERFEGNPRRLKRFLNAYWLIGAIIAINSWNRVGVGTGMGPAVEVEEAAA